MACGLMPCTWCKQTTPVGRLPAECDPQGDLPAALCLSTTAESLLQPRAWFLKGADFCQCGRLMWLQVLRMTSGVDPSPFSPAVHTWDFHAGKAQAAKCQMKKYWHQLKFGTSKGGFGKTMLFPGGRTTYSCNLSSSIIAASIGQWSDKERLMWVSLSHCHAHVAVRWLQVGIAHLAFILHHVPLEVQTAYSQHIQTCDQAVHACSITRCCTHQRRAFAASGAGLAGQRRWSACTP